MADNKLNEFEVNTKPCCTMEERTEYFIKLEKWLQEAHAWQSVAAMFPYYLMSGQIYQQQQNGTPFVSQIPHAGITPMSNGQSVPTPEGIEYRIPPIWKRFVAELIDSVMLFILKLILTLFILDVMSAMDLEPYKLDLLETSLRIVDYRMAMEVASKILIWDLVHRLGVCIFEAVWIQNGTHGRIGGATPGKIIMGLRVVQCRSITPVDVQDNTTIVRVSPGTDLGLPLALGRSLVKSLIMTLLFPMCFSLFSFRFNRTGYDLACHSIVVEDPYRNQQRQQQQQQQQRQ